MAQWVGSKPTVCAIAIAMCWAWPGNAWLSHAAEQALQLEVFINGQPTNLIGSFVRYDDGKIGALAQEILDIGLEIDSGSPADQPVVLDDLPSVSYEYDERLQMLRIVVDDVNRKAQSFNLAAGQQSEGKAADQVSDWGAVLNYDFAVNSGDLLTGPFLTGSGASILLDGRVFSRFGTFEQLASVTVGGEQEPELLRLDTTFRHSRPDSMVTYRAGDLLTGGLSWTRPFRLAGIQARTDFALRPGFVSTAQQTLTGVASSPSTVDVFVNGAKVFSQEVAAGPFTLFNVPIMSGAGVVEMVVTGADGASTRTNVSVFSSPQILAKGLSEWSVEAGVPRLSYGTADDYYALSPVLSGTYRFGLTDWLTLESHAEAGAGTLTAGAGAVLSIGQLGVASGSVALSGGDPGTGAQLTGSFSGEVAGISFAASALRTFGNYDDVLAATSRLGSAIDLVSLYQTARPHVSLVGLTVGAPLPPSLGGNLSLGYTRSRDGADELTQTLSLAYSRPLPFGGSVSANALYDFTGTGRTTIYLGLSFPLDGDIASSASISGDQSGLTLNAEVSKSLGAEPGSVGWKVHDTEGLSSYREAALSYRSSVGVAQFGVRQGSTGTSVNFGLRGSIASLGGAVFFSDWIDDGFAVVKAGVPNLEVYRENVLVGVTQANGMLLVPQLRAYEDNLITIDPVALPVDAELGDTRQLAAPDAQGGVVVDFTVKTTSDAALLTFVGPSGAVLPAGAVGTLADGTEFFVGYDGQAFIEHLEALNTVTIDLGNGLCDASFDFVAVPGTQVQIGPVTCS